MADDSFTISSYYEYLNSLTPVDSSFRDYWLKADSQEILENALTSVGICLSPTIYSSYDPVGVIERETGEFDHDGKPILTTLSGWHANLRMSCELTEQQKSVLEPFLISKPNNPSRIWG